MKKMLSLVMSISLLTCIFITNVKAISKTVLYLDYGDIELSETSISGYDRNGIKVSAINDEGYIITQLDPEKSLSRCVKIISGYHIVELQNINIERKGSFDYSICLLNDSNVKFIISGKNYIVSGLYRAGIDISEKATAVIEGTGYLNVQSPYEAAIGGGNSNSNGTLIINSGTIYAVGGINGYSAGIGGANSGDGGKIIINNGNITAIGGKYAAGIGGGDFSDGGNVTINGGTITAIGGDNAAGIGGGYRGNGGKIIINGGSVKATGGEGAAKIGNGFNCDKPFEKVINSNGQVLDEAIFSSVEFTEIYIDDLNSVPITSAHYGDKNLYFYLTNEYHNIDVYNGDTLKRYELDEFGIFRERNSDFSNYRKYREMIIVPSFEKFITVENVKLSENDKFWSVYKDNKKIGDYLIVEEGDVDMNLVINSADALLTLQISVGRKSPDEFEKLIADYNNDGIINSFDALMILKKAVENPQ